MSQWHRENPELVGTDADPWMDLPSYRAVVPPPLTEQKPGAVINPSDLLSEEFVEKLWAGLPLTVFHECEEEWDDDDEVFRSPEDCGCERRTIICVRNALAAALGEPQLPAPASSRKQA